MNPAMILFGIRVVRMLFRAGKIALETPEQRAAREREDRNSFLFGCLFWIVLAIVVPLGIWGWNSYSEWSRTEAVAAESRERTGQQMPDSDIPPKTGPEAAARSTSLADPNGAPVKLDNLDAPDVIPPS